MYSRLYQQCNGVSRAKSSATKFLQPYTCKYYTPEPDIARNIIPDADVHINYNVPCFNYDTLKTQFTDVIKEETGEPENLLSPKMWGPHAWQFLEAVAFGYPEQPTEDQKKTAKQFFEALSMLLPCSQCQEHFKENVLKMPPNVESRDTLSRWLCDFHNLVNNALGKNIHIDYEEVLKKYPRECESCKLPDFK